MSIHKKMFIFIPLLVLLMSFLSYFLFQSSKSVQESYSLIMDRILLYKQVSRESREVMRYLNRYVIQLDADSYPELKRHTDDLKNLRNQIGSLEKNEWNALAVQNYLNMMDTFLEQTWDLLTSMEQDSKTKAVAYLQAEQTSRYIGEDGQSLVDLELEHYRPIYENIILTTKEINKLGIYLVFTVALFSIVIALWLSSSISGPIRRLVLTAKQISKGKLDTKAPELNTGDEIGILCQTFNHMLDNIQDLMDKNVKSMEKDRLVKELELKTLQSQINPHFLFNTLNAIAKLAYIEGAEKTSDLTVSVSRLLRYNLQKLDHPVTLREEVENALEYLVIQKARFRDRIRYITEIDESVIDQTVPCLTLQPILENALVHGIESMEEGAILRLSIQRKKDGIEIEISDNGAGMEEDTRSQLLNSVADGTERSPGGKSGSTGLGTANVFKRLHLFFDGEAGIDIISGIGQGTTVRFSLPIRTP
jgi:sensor histidine kinase YesM